jgi:hypothetical protein
MTERDPYYEFVLKVHRTWRDEQGPPWASTDDRLAQAEEICGAQLEDGRQEVSDFLFFLESMGTAPDQLAALIVGILVGFPVPDWARDLPESQRDGS